MVAVADLLNPEEEPPRVPLPVRRPSPPPVLHPPPPTLGSNRIIVEPRDDPRPVGLSRPLVGPSSRMADDANSFRTSSRRNLRASVRYPPFEDFDEATLRELRRFRVHPLGGIQNTSERIPYNSGKKSFSTTGREGFEVFHYTFKMPGEDTPYTVMWDYSVGLVRMTPFFKCCGYPKTMPAKMLGMNPGLKDITYSITGGSIKAQGYWMPYSCARAVCATFCYKIAPALIPIFGPRFPAECVPEGAPEYQRMVIDPAIVRQARIDTDQWRRMAHVQALPSPRSSRSVSPTAAQRQTTRPWPSSDTYDQYHYSRRGPMSPYTDTELDYPPPPRERSYRHHGYSLMPPLPVHSQAPPASRLSSFQPLPQTSAPSPSHSPRWTAVNRPHPRPVHAGPIPRHPSAPHHAPGQFHDELPDRPPTSMPNPNQSWPMTPNPLLSAVPRSSTPTVAVGVTGSASGNQWNEGYYAARSHQLPQRPVSYPFHGNSSLPSHRYTLSSSSPTSSQNHVFPPFQRGPTLPPLRLLKRSLDEAESETKDRVHCCEYWKQDQERGASEVAEPVITQRFGDGHANTGKDERIDDQKDGEIHPDIDRVGDIADKHRTVDDDNTYDAGESSNGSKGHTRSSTPDTAIHMQPTIRDALNIHHAMASTASTPCRRADWRSRSPPSCDPSGTPKTTHVMLRQQLFRDSFPSRAPPRETVSTPPPAAARSPTPATPPPPTPPTSTPVLPPASIPAEPSSLGLAKHVPSIAELTASRAYEVYTHSYAPARPSDGHHGCAPANNNTGNNSSGNRSGVRLETNIRRASEQDAAYLLLNMRKTTTEENSNARSNSTSTTTAARSGSGGRGSGSARTVWSWEEEGGELDQDGCSGKRRHDRISGESGRADSSSSSDSDSSSGGGGAAVGIRRCRLMTRRLIIDNDSDYDDDPRARVTPGPRPRRDGQSTASARTARTEAMSARTDEPRRGQNEGMDYTSASSPGRVRFSHQHHSPGKRQSVEVYDEADEADTSEHSNCGTTLRSKRRRTDQR